MILSNDPIDRYIQEQLSIGQTKRNAIYSVEPRPLPSAPERVLDAPGLIDDYYLNVLDWSRRNQLAVALGPTVYIWNGEEGPSVSELVTLPDGRYVSSLQWTHDARSLAVGCSDGAVEIWNPSLGRKIRTIAITDGVRIPAVAWNKHLLSIGCRDGGLGTHDVRIARSLVLQHAPVHRQEVCGLAWSPCGGQLASGSNDNVVAIWNLQKGTLSADPTLVADPVLLAGHGSAVKALAWCPWKAGLVASGGGRSDPTIRLWDQHGQLVSATRTDSQVTSLQWSRVTRELVSAHGHSRNQLAFWRYRGKSLELAGEIADGHGGRRILHTAISPDASTVVSAGADESIRFWRCFSPSEKGPLMMPVLADSQAVTKALLSPVMRKQKLR